MINWPTKAPDDVEDFAFDFTPSLETGETISENMVSADGVTINSSALAGNLVRVWLSGGVAGSVAKVTCSITTDAGRTFDEVAVLDIGGEAVTLAAAKSWIKKETDDEDALISGLMSAAVRTIEAQTGKKLTPRVVSQVADRFPLCRSEEIRLLYGPVSDVLAVAYDDSNGAEQALTDFRLVEGRSPRLLPAFGASFPATSGDPGAVRLSYVAGYAATELPPDLVQAALMLVGHWYQNRGAVNAGDRAAAVELPLGVQMLIAPYRPVGLA